MNKKNILFVFPSVNKVNYEFLSAVKIIIESAFEEKKSKHKVFSNYSEFPGLRKEFFLAIPSITQPEVHGPWPLPMIGNIGSKQRLLEFESVKKMLLDNEIGLLHTELSQLIPLPLIMACRSLRVPILGQFYKESQATVRRLADLSGGFFSGFIAISSKENPIYPPEILESDNIYEVGLGSNSSEELAKQLEAIYTFFL
jgi:hypothetical protein